MLWAKKKEKKAGLNLLFFFVQTGSIFEKKNQKQSFFQVGQNSCSKCTLCQMIPFISHTPSDLFFCHSFRNQNRLPKLTNLDPLKNHQTIPNRKKVGDTDKRDAISFKLRLVVLCQKSTILS